MTSEMRKSTSGEKNDTSVV